jgi:hypothetical protein
MLAAIDGEVLIVGAYTDLSGRVCPMLAAHRRGARTDVGRFPRAWDAFARARRPRPATERELQILRALLEESLAGPAGNPTVREQRRPAPTRQPAFVSTPAGRRAQAFVGLVLLTIAPLVIWHRVLADIFASFRWNASYVIGELSPWFLLLAGVVFLVPVVVSVGRTPESLLYPRARRAYVGWGTVLYLLGLALALQVSEVWRFAH